MNVILRETPFPKNRVFQIVQGDITVEHVDAIVNAANAQLAHGGGVAGLISRKGGSIIQQESNHWIREHGPVSHESPAYTSAGTLPSRYVIHTVGPVWGSGDEDAKLAAAVEGSLKTANALGLQSVSLPAISTGIFGFPKERAAGIIFETINNHLRHCQSSSLELVRLILFDDHTVSTFLKVWGKKT